MERGSVDRDGLVFFWPSGKRKCGSAQCAVRSGVEEGQSDDISSIDAWCWYRTARPSVWATRSGSFCLQRRPELLHHHLEVRKPFVGCAFPLHHLIAFFEMQSAFFCAFQTIQSHEAQHKREKSRTGVHSLPSRNLPAPNHVACGSYVRM